MIYDLTSKGVLFPCGADGIFVGEEVDPERIEKGASLHPGTRITGEKTRIGAGCEIGLTGPCVLNDMVLGNDVKLGSGFFEKSVLLDGVKLGSSIRVRENCLLEEGCELSFSVDVKHTFLLANVVLGSEINFCDVFMAGGTSRKDHSEIGSGVIHFNFTPFGNSGDKATASLLGDAHRGVFYRSKRIFIGGHSSLVGPLKIGYGSVVAAGSRLIRDVGENTLCFGEKERPADTIHFDFKRYNSIRRKVLNSVEYIAELAALWHWYQAVRAAVMPEHMLEAALEVINAGVEMRIERLDTLYEYLEESITRNKALNQEGLVRQQTAFREGWLRFRENLLVYQDAMGDTAARGAVVRAVEEHAAAFPGSFVAFITEGLDEGLVEKGALWLKSIVDELLDGAGDIVPKI